MRREFVQREIALERVLGWKSAASAGAASPVVRRCRATTGAGARRSGRSGARVRPRRTRASRRSSRSATRRACVASPCRRPAGVPPAAASRKASTSCGLTTNRPSGLRKSDAILARNLLGATPADAVSCVSSRIAARIACATSVAEAERGFRMRDVEIGLVQRQRFDQVGMAREDLAHLARHRLVAREIGRHEDRVRAQPLGAQRRHRGAHAELARLVARRADHRTRASPGHDHRPAAQGRIVALLHRSVERIHVDVHDLAEGGSHVRCGSGGALYRARAPSCPLRASNSRSSLFPISSSVPCDCMRSSCVQSLLRGLLREFAHRVGEFRAQCVRLAREFGHRQFLQRIRLLALREMLQQRGGPDAGPFARRVQQFDQQRHARLVERGEGVRRRGVFGQGGFGQQHRDRAAHQACGVRAESARGACAATPCLVSPRSAQSRRCASQAPAPSGRGTRHRAASRAAVARARPAARGHRGCRCSTSCASSPKKYSDSGIDCVRRCFETGRLPCGSAVRILAIGQEQEQRLPPVAHARQHRFERAPRGCASGAIAVEAEQNVRRWRNSISACSRRGRRAQCGDRLWHAGLVQAIASM